MVRIKRRIRTRKAGTHASHSVGARGTLSGGSMGFAETRKVDFNRDAVGQPPKDSPCHTARWRTRQMGHTGGRHEGGTNKFLAQTDADSTRSRFPVAVLTDITTADVDLAVRVKPVRVASTRRLVSCGVIKTRTILHRSRERAREQRGVAWRDSKRTDLPLKARAARTARRLRCRRGSGARCAWSPLVRGSRCTSMERSA
jgi:hypothetical protein